jgi:hypothetical protein
VTWHWLVRLGEFVPGAADAIARAAIKAGITWEIGATTYSASQIGCFLPDYSLLSVIAINEIGNLGLPHRRVPPDWITAWRARAFGCGTADVSDLPVVPALPSDMILLSHARRPGISWLDPARPVSGSHLAQVAGRLSRSVEAVADRLGELGYQVPDVPAVSAGLDGEPVTPRKVHPSPMSGHAEQPSSARRSWVDKSSLGLDDLELIRLYPFGDGDRYSRQTEWLDSKRQVPLAHIVRAALARNCPAIEIADRLEHMGYAVPDVNALLARGRPGPG